MKKIYFYDKYLFLNNVSGIYKFYNLTTQKCYIGRSFNIYQRIGEHLRHSHNQNDNNYNSHFYAALRKYDFDEWDISCIYESDNINEMIEKEAYYICKYDSVKNGYNSTYETASAPPKSGEDHPNAKLLNEDVYKIREAYLKILNPQDVYTQYKDKISYATFINIWRGYHYNDIHMDVYSKENRQKHFLRGNKYLIYDSGHFDSTIKHVMEIRKDYVEEKLSPSEVYAKHSDLNRNTFNDIWYGRTFKDIVPDGYWKKLKTRRYIRRGNNKNVNKNN